MAQPDSVLDRPNGDAGEPESLPAAALRVGDFAMQQNLAALEALLTEPSAAEAGRLAQRAGEQADLIGAEIERFLSLLPPRS